MHGLNRLAGSRSGHSLIEVVLALALAAALAPPLLGGAARMRAAVHLRDAQERAVRLLAEARWTAVRDGGATVELTANPPAGRVISATGDTIATADLGPGGATLRLSRNRAVSRIRFGPMGVGWVASRTLRFALADEERSLVVSSLGRVTRR